MPTQTLTRKNEFLEKTFLKRKKVFSPYFSNIGNHKESLCIYKEKEVGGEKKQDFAEQNPAEEKEEKSQSDFSSIQEQINNFLKQIEEIQKQIQEEEFSLISKCLNIQNQEKVLKQNSKDKENIKKLQSFLKKKKYLFDRVDGIFGNNTKSALILFQKDNKLKSNGIFESETVQ
jgi:hypothetical protein